MRLLRSHLLWKTIGSTLAVLYIMYIKKFIEKVYAYTFFFINVKNIYKKKLFNLNFQDDHRQHASTTSHFERKNFFTHFIHLYSIFVKQC